MFSKCRIMRLEIVALGRRKCPAQRLTGGEPKCKGFAKNGPVALS